MYIFSWTLYIFMAFLTAFLFRRSYSCKSTVLVRHNKVSFSLNIVTIFLFFMLLLFAVMRKIEPGIGGTDAHEYLQKIDNVNISYKSYFETIRTKRLLKIEEPLFKLFVIWCSQRSNSHAVFLFVVYASIVLLFLCFVRKFYCRTSNFFPTILLICCFLSSFNILRSWWSVALCMGSFNLLVDKKYVKSLALILVSSLIHYMGFCFLLVWLCCLLYDKIPRLFKRRTILCFCIGINVVTFASQSILKDYVTDTKYSAYTGLFGTVSIVGYLPTILICLYSIWLFDKYKTKDDKVAKCIIAMAVNLSLMYTITFLLAWRINDFFALIRMYMLSVFFCSFKEKEDGRIFSFLLYLFVAVVFVQQMLALWESSGVFPYRLFFM